MNDRKGTIGGGVLIAIRSDVISEQLSADSDTESIYATVTLEKGNRLIIGALYRPPVHQLNIWTICAHRLSPSLRNTGKP